MITVTPSLINRDTSSLTRCGNNDCQNNSSTLLKCSRCHSQKYCGAECQKIDWPRHKKVCRLESAQMISKQTESKAEEVKTSLPESSMREVATQIPGLRLIENFISDDLHDRFIQQVGTGIPEQNDGHYDGYLFPDPRGIDQVCAELTRDVFAKLKKLGYFSNEKKPFYLGEAIVGYEKDGYITRHVDSKLLCGETVIVISFNTPVVVNFYSEKKTDAQHHKIFVPPKSMYSISGEARNDWSHAILKGEDTYQSKKFERGKRYAFLLIPPGPLHTGSVLFEY